MSRRRSLSAPQIAQLIAIAPVSLAALFGAGMGVIALGDASRHKAALDGFLLTAGLFVLPFFSVTCLWVAILSNDVAVATRRHAFSAVWTGLVLGCALAGFLAARDSRDAGSAVFYGFPLVIAAWHLYRLTRILWQPDPSLERP